MRTSPLMFVPFAVAGFAVPAQAAPQILALLETSVPVVLRCSGETCTVTLGSYCLQVERQASKNGMRLNLAQGGRISLVLRRGDGITVQIDAGARATFMAARKEYAVRVSVPRSLVGTGAASAAVEVGPNVSLVPQKIAGDPQPYEPREIRKVTSVDRLAGQRMERGRFRSKLQAARVLNRVANLLDRGLIAA